MGGALSPKSVCWFQKFSRDALHEIHELAAKYDGIISERDKYIRGVLLAMSFDPPHEFICRQSYKIARDKTGIYPSMFTDKISFLL